MASEEVVLGRVMQMLLISMRPTLAKTPIALVSTCFHVAQQARAKEELLQHATRHIVHVIICCVFSQHPDIDATSITNEQASFFLRGFRSAIFLLSFVFSLHI
jgi:hypothetical protein